MAKIVLTAIVVAGMFIFIPAIFEIAKYILIGVGLVAIARMLVRIGKPNSNSGQPTPTE